MKTDQIERRQAWRALSYQDKHQRLQAMRAAAAAPGPVRDVAPAEPRAMTCVVVLAGSGTSSESWSLDHRSDDVPGPVRSGSGGGRADPVGDLGEPLAVGDVAGCGETDARDASSMNARAQPRSDAPSRSARSRRAARRQVGSSADELVDVRRSSSDRRRTVLVEVGAHQAARAQASSVMTLILTVREAGQEPPSRQASTDHASSTTRILARRDDFAGARDRRIADCRARRRHVNGFMPCAGSRATSRTSRCSSECAVDRALAVAWSVK